MPSANPTYSFNPAYLGVPGVFITRSRLIRNKMKPVFTDNSRVYYKPGSLAAGGIGTVRNSAVKSRKI